MCPACITTLAIVAGGATSAGGVSALVIRKLRIWSVLRKSTTLGTRWVREPQGGGSGLNRLVNPKGNKQIQTKENRNGEYPGGNTP